MSSRQSPRNSKSKSCHCKENNAETNLGTFQEEELEEMERQLEEDIATSERLIRAASSIMAKSKGRVDSTCEKPRSQPSTSLSKSSYLRLPSPPQQSPSEYGSNRETPRSSQKSIRQQTLESSQSRANYSTPIEREVVVFGGRRTSGDLINPGDVDYFNVDSFEQTGEENNNGQSDESNANRISLGLSSRSRASSRGHVSAHSSLHLSSLPNASGAMGSSPGQIEDSLPCVEPLNLSQGSNRHSNLKEESSLKEEGSRFLEEMEQAAAKYDPRNTSNRLVNCQIEESHSGRSRTGSPIGAEHQAQNVNYQRERSQLGKSRTTSPIGAEHQVHHVNCQREGFHSGRSRTTSPTEHQAHHVHCQRGILQQAWSRAISPKGAERHAYHSGHGSAPDHSQISEDPFISSSGISNVPHSHHHHHHDEELSADALFRNQRAEAALAHLSQLKRTPSFTLCKAPPPPDFLSVCSPRKGKVKLPEMPCMEQEELNELIKCERQDVDSTNYLTSEVMRTYKKPCPKQTKAQMNVKSLMKAYTSKTCGEKYTPLEHPDPSDISPEVAAKMMFTQEKGIKMDDCPKATIAHLFPDETNARVPRSTISIVDQSQKDREEMIEKSASVPSEGVSDSAYTRKMKEKGEDSSTQKSYDFDVAIGQSKREYVLVAQKPLRFSKVQYRGGTLPSWFPGYFAAFPDEDGSIKTVPSPSGLFQKAWMHTNPRNMPTNDVLVLE